MLEVINLIISCIIQSVSCIYTMSYLTKRKTEINKQNIWIICIMTILFYILVSIDIVVAKPLLIYLIVIICFKYFYKITFNESVIASFISMILNGLSEALSSIIIILLRVPQAIIQKYLQNTPLSNIIIFLVIIIIIKYFKKYFIKLKGVMEKERITYIFYFIMAIGITLLLSKNIGNWKNNVDFIVNGIIIAVFIIIVFSLFQEKHKTHKKTEEFNELFKQSESVKTLLNRYKKYNHENKNQLIVIRENSAGNEKVIDYIDSILNEKVGHEDKWISELSYITDPGISGFLSVKINQMIDKKIKVTLTISPRVKNFKFEKIKSKEYKEICRVLGVYLDNAYEASKETNKKEVTIEMMMDNNRLTIIISNSYKGKIEIDKIDKEGYTTKGKNHGVGLSLVKDIINSNSKLEQRREVIKDYFYQYLYVKN